jgi:rare lipoprotein A (peptidoglycan hydrolase)
MPMRRTIGISLACLMIAASAEAKAPETSHHPAQSPSVKPGKAEARVGKIRYSCSASRAHRSGRHSAHHSGRVRHRDNSAQAAVGVSGGGPDSYIGPMRIVGRGEIGKAAWYGLVGNYTSSGERLDTVTPTAAHRSLPLASYAKVTSLDSGRSVVVKINDRGPHSRRFIIDLSPRAADEIDMKRAGVAAVVVEPVFVPPAPSNESTSTIAVLDGSGTPVAQ